jgi:imidazolonepropionase
MWDLLVTETAGGGAIAVEGERIAWAGTGVPPRDAAVVWPVGGRLVTPGLVDCHTHLVFGGDRSGEWEQRLAGATYEEIAAAGGGILSTVRATRAASDDELVAGAAGRAATLAAGGVTTIEVKSGYGLDLDTELRMLRVARRLSDQVAVDGFCERIAFTPEHIARVFDAATRLGLPVKLHADQLSNSGGAALAARHHALSADHLEHASPDGIAAMAVAGTVAVLLPGAAYVLRDDAAPPVDTLRAAGVPMAVASDCNPGTSPLVSLLTAMHLACTRFGLTVAEAFAGTTEHAARALGLAGEAGVVAPGARADLVVWDAERPAQVVYWIGANPVHAVLKRGRFVVGGPG